MRFLLPVILGAVALGATPVSAPPARMEPQSPDAPERIALAKVQVLLDRAGFRPGKIDGLGGEFTQRAADRYCDAQGVPRGSVIDTSSIASPFTDYVVRAEDFDWVGPTSTDPVRQATFKKLLYGSIAELVSERFHCDQKYLAELNPGVGEATAGAVLRVPDVEPFRIEDLPALAKGKRAPSPAPPPVRDLQPATYDLNQPIPAGGSGVEDMAAAPPEPSPQPKPEPVRRLLLLRAERLIELFEDDRLAGCFPCTPGSSRIPVQPGQWKITSNILLPHFRWDKSVLETGVRSENAHLLPPGPNSPVGIVWMGINRPSIGLHGTHTPDRIGRNESSGCIRLANWDALFLSQRLSKGTLFEVR